MSVCLGCGRCRECGHVSPFHPWVYQPQPPTYPHWNWWQAPYCVGDPMPGQLGSITITNTSGSAV